MEKRWKKIILFLSILMPLLFINVYLVSAASISCSDSDSGLNPLIKGKARI